jgi:hypothetical protein
LQRIEGENEEEMRRNTRRESLNKLRSIPHCNIVAIKIAIKYNKKLEMSKIARFI